MFSKSSAIPQRKPFSLTWTQIVEDIESVSSSEDYRKLLFTCLDDKLPQERNFAKMEAFLKGSQQLEEKKQKLDEQIGTLQNLAQNLMSSIDEIEGKIEACQ